MGSLLEITGNIFFAILGSSPVEMLKIGFSQMFEIRRGSLVSPKLTQTTLFYVHCVPQEGGRMQGWESIC